LANKAKPTVKHYSNNVKFFSITFLVEEASIPNNM